MLKQENAQKHGLITLAGRIHSKRLNSNYAMAWVWAHDKGDTLFKAVGREQVETVAIPAVNPDLDLSAPVVSHESTINFAHGWQRDFQPRPTVNADGMA